MFVGNALYICPLLLDDPMISVGCQKPDLKENGHCEDETNSVYCEFDGGDCCGSNVVTTFCSACQCLDPNYSGDSAGE